MICLEDLTMNLAVISEREFQENTFRMGRSQNRSIILMCRCVIVRKGKSPDWDACEWILLYSCMKYKNTSEKAGNTCSIIVKSECGHCAGKTW